MRDDESISLLGLVDELVQETVLANLQGSGLYLTVLLSVGVTSQLAWLNSCRNFFPGDILGSKLLFFASDSLLLDSTESKRLLAVLHISPEILKLLHSVLLHHLREMLEPSLDLRIYLSKVSENRLGPFIEILKGVKASKHLAATFVLLLLSERLVLHLLVLNATLLQG